MIDTDFLPWTIVVVGALLFGSAYCLKLRRAREEKFERFANEFYDRVKPLIIALSL